MGTGLTVRHHKALNVVERHLVRWRNRQGRYLGVPVALPSLMRPPLQSVCPSQFLVGQRGGLELTAPFQNEVTDRGVAFADTGVPLSDFHHGL